MIAIVSLNNIVGSGDGTGEQCQESEKSEGEGEMHFSGMFEP